MDAFAASLAKAQATRAETLLAQSASLRQLSTTSAAGSTEALAANEAAARRQTQAYKLLGIQAAATGESVTKTAGTIGRGLTTYATVPAAFIGYEAVKQALDFNQSLLLIRTQAGASQAELEHMNTAVLQLVQSGHSYGQTAHDMANSLFYVESEGIRGSRALATIQAAAAGAAKGQTDMADTTNALTSAMKIWNVPASEAAKTMATIDAITATGKMHLQDLNEAFNTRFFSTAQAIGVPLEQAGALLDVFTKMGVPASSAATNLTTTFIRMVDPAKGAGNALQQLGLSTAQLGRDLQTGGITKALADLTAGYDHLVKTQGPAAGEAAIFGAFGGSHGGGAALQAVKGYQSYLQSLGEVQRLNNPATFWSQVSQTMDQPAMKIKQDVAEIGADFIKLGTALAPSVAALASGITKITNAFSSLPGPIKKDIGEVAAVLAIGGPIGLAVGGLGKLIGGFKTLLSSMGFAAETGAVTTDTALASIGTTATAAETKVGGLRGSLVGLRGIGPIAIPITLLVTEEIKNEADSYRSSGIPGAIHSVGHNFLTRSVAKGFGPTGQVVGDVFKALDYILQNTGSDSGGGPSASTMSQADRAVKSWFGDITHPRSATKTDTTTPPRRPPPIQQFVLPYKLQLAQAQAGLTKSLRDDMQVSREVVAYAKQQIDSGHLTHAAMLQAVQAEGAALNQLWSDETKQAKARTKKLDTYALPARLQEEVAKADAEAALHPSNYGPDSDQIRLAKEAKAAAMRAINSHKLTLQGLAAAWQIVGQENSILAQAKGAINTYHAVYSKSITDSVKRLSQAQQMQLRERIAQAESHRGYAPNQDGTQGRPRRHDVHVHVHSNDSHIVKVVDRHHRDSHQRAGARR